MTRPGKIAQSRIGVHPSTWKLEPQVERMLCGCDAQIAPQVRIMCAGDFETFESCQGGPGHAYPEPTICFHGSHAEGYRALAWMLDHGMPVGDLRRYWSIQDGQPHGPEWQMTFRFTR